MRASTPPYFDVPARLAWRSTSPLRSTPGPLPYHSEKTPSYLPSPRISACCAPQIAVAARSSFSPGMKVTPAASKCRLARSICASTPPSGEPRYPVTKPAVLSPARRSSSFCIRRRRTTACVPVISTRSLPRSYRSSSVQEPSMGSSAEASAEKSAMFCISPATVITPKRVPGRDELNAHSSSSKRRPYAAPASSKGTRSPGTVPVRRAGRAAKLGRGQRRLIQTTPLRRTFSRSPYGRPPLRDKGGVRGPGSRPTPSRPMDKRSRAALLPLLGLAWLLCVTGAARAHPHVWVAARSQVVFGPDGKILGLRQAWEFDEMYSAFAVQGLGKDGKPPTREELAPLAKTNVESLKEFDYFTFAKQGGAKLKFKEPVEATLEADDRKIVTLRFFLPLETPVSVKKPFSFQVYDPTYYVSFGFEKQDPVTLAKAPEGCSVSAFEPKPLAAEENKQLTEAFFQNFSPGADFGVKLATR